MIGRILIFYIHRGSRCQESFICCGCRNGTCIHQCYGCDLSALQLASFTVREVSGRVSDGECIIGRCISCAETWSTECGLHDRSCFHQCRNCSIFHKFHVNWCTCRVNTECKFIRTNIFSFDDICCSADIFKTAARASCNNTLIYIELSVYHFALQ